MEQNKERNPGSLTATRLFIVFAQELEFDNERTLQSCLDYAKLDPSDGSVIDRIMVLLPKRLLLLHALCWRNEFSPFIFLTVKDKEDYEDMRRNACDIVFESLKFARKTASPPWRYLVSFAASGSLFHHSSCFADKFWQSVFLSLPKKRPQIVTEEKHGLAILKTHFCYYTYGKSSRLFIRWMSYSHSLSPSADELQDFTTLPDLMDPLVDLWHPSMTDMNDTCNRIQITFSFLLFLLLILPKREREWKAWLFYWC